MNRNPVANAAGFLSGLRLRDLAWAYRQRRRAGSIIMHRKRIVRMQVPDAMLLPVLCGLRRPRWQRPADLSIVLVHNYDTPPIMERSLRYAGINDFVVLRPNGTGPWRHSFKMMAILDYLRTACTTEYLLYVDSNDAVVTDDPGRVIPLLQEYDCDLLFSATRYAGGYECMPEIRRWADERSRDAGYQNFYLNAGVFAGRSAFVREIFETATAYVTDNDLPSAEFARRRREGRLCEALPEFPKGVGCDQTIMRYLQPRFHPRVKIDFRCRLAGRSRQKRSFKTKLTRFFKSS